jgi:hypothetical protein
MSDNSQVQKTSSKNTKQAENVKIFGYKWFCQWTSLLVNVFLAGATINCMFRWFSYGYVYDLTAAVFSFLLALVVYFTSFSNSKTASYSSRLSISALALIVWMLFFPLVLTLAGFKQ